MVIQERKWYFIFDNCFVIGVQIPVQSSPGVAIGAGAC
jgi:hypothetical protein